MSMEIKPGYKMTEVGVIPDEWDLVTAGQIGRFRGGNGFPLKFQGEVTGTYPFFKVSDMNNEGNETRMFVANNYISDITRKTLGATIFAENSIVFAKVGAAIFLERKRILAQPSCLDNNMTAFELDDKKADYRYVHHRLIHTRLSDLVSTTALPSLSGNVLSQIKFPLPMLEEQRAIASALSDVDVLLTEIDRLIAKKRDIQQATMQQLLTGQRRLPGFNGEWEVKRLGEVAPLQRGYDLPNPKLEKGEYPVVYSNGVMNYHSTFMVKGPGVVTGRSGTIGNVHYIEDSFWPHNTSLWVTNFRGNSPKFISYLLASVGLIRFSTGSGVPTLNRNDVHAHEVSIPPSEKEQTAIATILSDMDAELAALEARHEKARQLKHGIMQELLTGRTRLIDKVSL